VSLKRENRSSISMRKGRILACFVYPQLVTECILSLRAESSVRSEVDRSLCCISAISLSRLIFNSIFKCYKEVLIVTKKSHTAWQSTEDGASLLISLEGSTGLSLGAGRLPMLWLNLSGSRLPPASCRSEPWTRTVPATLQLAFQQKPV